MSRSLTNMLHSTGAPSANKIRWTKLIILILTLSIVFLLPEVLMNSGNRSGGVSMHMYMKSALYIAIFLINYYVIIDRSLSRPKGYVRFVICNVGVIALFMSIIWLTFLPHPPTHPAAPFAHHPHMIGPHEPFMGENPVHPWFRAISMSIRDLIMAVLTIALSVAIKLSDLWMRMAHEKQEIEARQHQNELESLKHQLNPHFLFNTLNSIYALIAISPQRAQNAIHILSKMLRYVLYENTPTVPLSDEFDFVNSYTKLMRMRLGESFPINMQMSNDTPELRVAPLIFISPIENAFKHGNTGQPNAFIDIIITATNGVVKAHIANRFNTAANNNISQVVRQNDDHGIGDANLRRRLELIYGDNASIKSTVDGDIYSVDMTINLITNNPTKTSN